MFQKNATSVAYHIGSSTVDKRKIAHNYHRYTGISNYDAANVLVKGNRSTLVRCFRRVYTTSYNENPVDRNDAMFS